VELGHRLISTCQAQRSLDPVKSQRFFKNWDYVDQHLVHVRTKPGAFSYSNLSQLYALQPVVNTVLLSISEPRMRGCHFAEWGKDEETDAESRRQERAKPPESPCSFSASSHRPRGAHLETCLSRGKVARYDALSMFVNRTSEEDIRR
jgi:hypothetical protein